MKKAKEEMCVINTPRYRGEDNLPTCSRGLHQRQGLRVPYDENMGTKFVCFYDLSGRLRWRTKDCKRTYLEPDPKCCRLWGATELAVKDRNNDSTHTEARQGQV